MSKFPILFDIIIEDASHTLADQIQHFVDFGPKVNKRGVYVIEDIDKDNFERLLATTQVGNHVLWIHRDRPCTERLDFIPSKSLTCVRSRTDMMTFYLCSESTIRSQQQLAMRRGWFTLSSFLFCESESVSCTYTNPLFPFTKSAKIKKYTKKNIRDQHVSIAFQMNDEELIPDGADDCDMGRFKVP